MAPRTIPGSQLKAECRLLEKTVLGQQLATSAELKAWKPGGLTNPDTGVQGWLRYLTRLHRFHARGERRDTLADRRQLQDTEVLKALKEEPIAVLLPSAVGYVEKGMVQVYPKSMDALMLVHGLDVQLSWMMAQRKELLDMTSASALDALPKVLSAISYTYQLLVWIVTHPGPEAPFRAEDDHPLPPEWIQKLEPWDYVIVCDAHQRHMLRLQALAALLDDRKSGDEEEGQRPSWSVFYGSLSLETGQPIVELMRHRSLVSLMAAVRLSNYSMTPAKKEAPDAAP